MRKKYKIAKISLFSKNQGGLVVGLRRRQIVETITNYRSQFVLRDDTADSTDVPMCGVHCTIYLLYTST